MYEEFPRSLSLLSGQISRYKSNDNKVVLVANVIGTYQMIYTKLVQGINHVC